MVNGRNIKNKVAIGIMIGALTIGSGFSALAATTTATTTNTKTTNQKQFKHNTMGAKMDLSQLVSQGVIDQKTADAITSYMDTKQADRKAEMEKLKSMTDEQRKAYLESNKTNMDLFADLVSKNIITQSQADAIKAAMPQKGERMGADFSNLVTKGTIDQATADKMKAFVEKKQQELKAEKQNIAAMTDTERQQYLDNLKAQGKVKKDILTDMVTNGIITQSQADAIQKDMPQKQARINKQLFMMKTDFSDLVTKGTIDQATADKMKAFVEKKQQELQVEKQKVAAMTDTERQQYLDNLKAQGKVKKDMLTDMVTNGILTQTQADAIKATMPQKDTAK